MAIKESGEMYLENILVLQQKNGAVRSIDIANYAHFSKPSVSRAMKILKADGYLDVDDNGYIHLTEQGQKLAESIYERHVFLTDFLTEIGVDPIIAVKGACKIEHDISPESFQCLKKFVLERNKE